ncbi:MAG: SCO6880 family protein [Ilumatobacteraceae bacterium]
MKFFFPATEAPAMVGVLKRDQVMAIGIGVMVAVAAFSAGAPLIGFAVALVAAGWALLPAPGTGLPLRKWLAAELRWKFGRSAKAWSAPITSEAGRDDVPGCLRDVRYLVADPVGLWSVGAAIGVVRAGHEFSVVFPVEGPQIAMLANESQLAQLSRWGVVLSQACSERGEAGVSRISWTDVHGAADPDALIDYHRKFGVDGPTSADYQQFLSGVVTSSATHRTFVTVSVNARKVGVLKARGAERIQLMCNAAAEQAMAVATALTDEGFVVGRPLTPLALSRLVQSIGDPYVALPRATTALERAGLPEPGQSGPRHVVPNREWVEVDGAVHRAFQIRFPAREVPGDWLFKLLDVQGPKVITMIYRPVPPTQSINKLDAELARVGSNNEVSRRRKGRVSVRQRREQMSIESREVELVAGHQEVKVVGLVAMCGRDPEEVVNRGKVLQRTAQRQGGARVTPLETQHAEGWAAALPVGVEIGEARS